MKIISGLQQYGDYGWAWTEPDYIGQSSCRCRTNGDGEGLWYWARSGATNLPEMTPVMEWKQIMGTCQFYLPRNRKAAYSRLYRRWKQNNQYEER